MNTEALFKMTKGRIALIRLHPFFGSLAMHLQMIEDPSLNPATVATDGIVLRYHPDYIVNSTQDDVTTSIAHEVGHCALQHSARRNGRTAKRWNHAVDYAVNDMLVSAGMTLPDGWLHSPSFAGQSAEEIYNQLPPDDENDQDGDGPFDGHSDAPVSEQTQQDWQIATAQAAQTAAKLGPPGDTPGYLKRFLDELHAPKVCWRDVLRRFATASNRSDYSWAKPNRAYLSMGIILPGLDGKNVSDVTTVIDTSGSITDEILTTFGSEIADIRNTAQPDMARVIYCDADVNHVDEFEKYDHFHVEPHGGGGTDFRPPFAHLEQRDITPSCLIYLTDGYGPFPDAPPPYPVLWVMTTDVQPPWGEVVRIEL